MIDPLGHHNRTFRHHVNGVDIHMSTHAHELSEGPHDGGAASDGLQLGPLSAAGSRPTAPSPGG